MDIALDYYVQMLENGFTPSVAKNRTITFMRNKMLTTNSISEYEYDKVFDLVSRINYVMSYQSKGIY